MVGSREASTLSSAPTTSNIAKPAVDVVGAREASSLSTTPSSPSTNPTKAPGNPEPPVVPTAPYRLEIHLPDLSLRAPSPPVEPVRIESLRWCLIRACLLSPSRILTHAPLIRFIKYPVIMICLPPPFSSRMFPTFGIPRHHLPPYPKKTLFQRWL